MKKDLEKLKPLPDLQPGDILLYGGGDLVNWLIEFRTWSEVSHIEIYVGDGRSVASRNGIGVNEYPLRVLGLRRVYRPLSLPGIGGVNIQTAMSWFETVKGTPYGWGDLARFYLVNIPTKGLICSEFADLWFRNGGLPLFNTNYPEGAVCPGNYEQVSSLLLNQIWSWK